MHANGPASAGLFFRLSGRAQVSMSGQSGAGRLLVYSRSRGDGGSVKQMVAPASIGPWAQMRPPWGITMRRNVARPMPSPANARGVQPGHKGWNSRLSGGSMAITRTSNQRCAPLMPLCSVPGACTSRVARARCQAVTAEMASASAWPCATARRQRSACGTVLMLSGGTPACASRLLSAAPCTVSQRRPGALQIGQGRVQGRGGLIVPHHHGRS